MKGGNVEEFIEVEEYYNDLNEVKLTERSSNEREENEERGSRIEKERIQRIIRQREARPVRWKVR